jgi:hypothetical protein
METALNLKMFYKEQPHHKKHVPKKTVNTETALNLKIKHQSPQHHKIHVPKKLYIEKELRVHKRSYFWLNS